jgi:hypothetical protein
MKPKKESFIRINSRITREQHSFVKMLAKQKRISEGEAHRSIIDFYISKSK